MNKEIFRGKSAVIDVGSNSVRLMLMADGNVLYKTLLTTRLGEGIAFTPRLKQEAITRTAAAVGSFLDRAAAEGAACTYVYATAAVREAENGADFVSLVQRLYGISIDVLSGEEEAETGIDGALFCADGALLDVGGASTELAIKEGNRIVYKKSVPLGVVKLKDVCARDRAAILSQCKIHAPLFDDAAEYLARAKALVAIGGTATTLAALSKNLTVYDARQVTGTFISTQKLSSLAQDLLSMPVEEIENLPCVSPKRADVIGGGAAWLSVLSNRFQKGGVTVSDADNLEGYARKKGLL